MDTIETLREELDLLQAEFNRIKNENLELHQNARLARMYRDEIDSLNYKLREKEKHEQELEKSNKRFHEMDALKNRIDELQNESKTHQYSFSSIHSYSLLDHILSQAQFHQEQQIKGKYEY